MKRVFRAIAASSLALGMAAGLSLATTSGAGAAADTLTINGGTSTATIPGIGVVPVLGNLATVGTNFSQVLSATSSTGATITWHNNATAIGPLPSWATLDGTGGVIYSGVTADGDLVTAPASYAYPANITESLVYATDTTGAVAYAVEAIQSISFTASKYKDLSPYKPTKTTVSEEGLGASTDTLEAGICNSDAVQISPTSDGLTSAVQPCTTPDLAPKYDAKTGAYGFSLTLDPGHVGDDAQSSCPGNQAQYANGVVCIVAVADLNSGAEVFDALSFAGNGVLSVTDTYVSGAGTSALYDLHFSTSGAGTESGYAPSTYAQETTGSTGNGTGSADIPNLGGFESFGLVIGPGELPVTQEGTQTGLEGCQAASSGTGAATWSPTETLCTFGASSGEPVLLVVTGETAANGSTPFPLTTSLTAPSPIDCSGASVATCQLSSGGNFSFSLDNVPAGKYKFEAVGASSGVVAKGSASLASSPVATS